MKILLIDRALSQLFQLVLHLTEILLLALSHRVYILSQSAKLLDLFDLAAHNVDHFVQVIRAMINFVVVDDIVLFFSMSVLQSKLDL